MSLHNQMKKLQASLEALAVQGRALLSCEDVTAEQVSSYKDLVDTVLEGAEMNLDDVSAAASKQDVEESTPAENIQPEADGMVVSSEDKKDSSDESDESEESDDEEEESSIDDVETPDDAEHEEAFDELADSVDESEEETPREDLEETVEKVDHIAQKVETFITHTEDSGLTTDDVQEMAGLQETFEAFSNLNANTAFSNGTKSRRHITALTRLCKVTTRNLSKRMSGVRES
jgi:cobalamin biosynthesis protein CobT